jgi:hypothetical protein|tara:strand:+ start:434 stop:862 length:429 start_codon:yes stop_codon:yes gene_type:complete
MPKNSKLVQTLKELIKREVQKEVKKIFITEGLIRPTVTSKPKDEVSYVKDPILNKVLNETAQKDGMEEYPTMGGGTFDSTKMAEAMGYGGKFGNPEMKRQAIGVSTAQAAGVNPDSVPEDVMKALTKDYSGVMKAINKRDNK